MRVKFRHGRAMAELHQLDPGLFALSNVWSGTRGRGDARCVMEQVIKYADENDAKVVAIAQRYGPVNLRGLDNEQLQTFYEKFGFEREGDGKSKYMVRYPSNF